MYNLPTSGDSMSVGSGHAEGAIDFSLDFGNARQAVPTNEPKRYADFSLNLERSEIPDPNQPGDTPDPGGGFAGTTVNFDSVAPPHNGPQSRAHVGEAGQGHGGFVLGSGRPD